MYVKKFNARYTEFQSYIRKQIGGLFQSAATTMAPTTSTTTATETTLPAMTFTRPFKSGEQSSEIKALQTVLAKQGLYNGVIDGIYSKATMEAIYQFQSVR